MEEKRNYEILKFVMHGDKCYMSTEYCEGKTVDRMAEISCAHYKRTVL